MAEEEEVEQLKTWWKENGRTVVVGVVIGLGSVGGWNLWQNHVRTEAERASTLYTQLVDAVAVSVPGQVSQQAGELIAAYPDSGYATLAALVAASSAARHDRRDEAKRRLEWAIGNGARPEYRDLARIRLARVLLDDTALDEALDELTGVGTEELRPAADELRGDILLAKGDAKSARGAYTEAIQSGALHASARSRVQMKLDDLGRLSIP